MESLLVTKAITAVREDLCFWNLARDYQIPVDAYLCTIKKPIKLSIYTTINKSIKTNVVKAYFYLQGICIAKYFI